MHTLTASRRAVVATTIGLALSISLVGCSRFGGPTATLANRYGQVGCSMVPIEGHLVAENGRAVLVGLHIGEAVPLDLPDGLTVRPTGDGQLEIVGDTGTVLARTGERIKAVCGR